MCECVVLDLVALAPGGQVGVDLQRGGAEGAVDPLSLHRNGHVQLPRLTEVAPRRTARSL